MCGIFSKLTMKTPKKHQCFLISPCHWSCSGGCSCSWICFSIYLSIICFIWCTMRWTHVPLNVTRSTKLEGAQCSPEIAFRSMDFRVPENIIFPALYADYASLSSKCDQASNLWQQLELASELESDLWDTVVWGRKWLVDVSAGKTQLVSFDWSNNSGAIDVKRNGPEEKSSLKMLELTFLSKMDWTLTLSLLLKLPPRKLEPWFVLWSFFLLRFLCISINLPYNLAWNTAVMSGLVLQVATWNC